MSRKVLRYGLAALMAAGLVSVVAAEAIAAHSSDRTTPVRELSAFSRSFRTLRVAALPGPVAELVDRTTAHFGTSPTFIQQAVSGSPSVYLASFSGGELCLYTSVQSAVAACYAKLREAGGSLAPNVVVVDGKLFVDGLIANDVRSVEVSVASTSNSPGASAVRAVLSGSVFVAQLPFNGTGTGAISVTLSRADGSTASAQLPGVPEGPVTPGP